MMSMLAPEGLHLLQLKLADTAATSVS